MNIVLTADFYDCQVKGGLIYLWDTWGKVIVVDIRELVTDLQKSLINAAAQFLSRQIEG